MRWLRWLKKWLTERREHEKQIQRNLGFGWACDQLLNGKSIEEVESHVSQTYYTDFDRGVEDALTAVENGKLNITFKSDATIKVKSFTLTGEPVPETKQCKFCDGSGYGVNHTGGHYCERCKGTGKDS